MEKIRIVVDSTFNLDQEVIEKYDITVIPLNVIIDGKSYQDKIDISLSEVMQAVEDGKKVSTSQPAPTLYKDAFDKLVSEGATDIISLSISSTLSGTFQSVNIAAMDFTGAKLHMVDTLTTSVGAEAMALYAIELMEEGKTAQEIVDSLMVIRHQGGILMNFEDLNVLVKSGRMSRAKALIGNLLRVKPIIQCFDGVVEVIAKKRTESAVLEYIEEHILEFLKEEIKKANKKIKVLIGHVRTGERMNRIMSFFKEKLDFIEIPESKEITPVIAINLGYSGFGIAWYYA